jgi:hypothetical protein
MHEHQHHRDCPTGRINRFQIAAAARVADVQPTTRQQVADIVRVTVDDEVDTRTFRAIVTDLAADLPR